MAHVIEHTGRPAIILAPNKTLAAQLYGEMKSFFPENAVEYFVSYYDYYQPEAYVPRTDTYVEKESSLNEQIDRMRHSATRAILERRDVVVVASRLVHLRHRFGRDLFADDPVARQGRPDQPHPALGPLRRIAVPAQRPQFLPRRVPGARRHDRIVSGALRGPRLAHFAVRRRDRGDPRDRPADRRKNRGAAIGQDLCQQPLCHAAPDPVAGDRADQARPQDPPSTSSTPKASCSRRSGSNSAPITISK